MTNRKPNMVTGSLMSKPPSSLASQASLHSGSVVPVTTTGGPYATTDLLITDCHDGVARELRLAPRSV